MCWRYDDIWWQFDAYIIRIHPPKKNSCGMPESISTHMGFSIFISTVVSIIIRISQFKCVNTFNIMHYFDLCCFCYWQVKSLLKIYSRCLFIFEKRKQIAIFPFPFHLYTITLLNKSDVHFSMNCNWCLHMHRKRE